VVEVSCSLSPEARRENFNRLREYEVFGARWHWLVEPPARLFEVCELHPGGSILHTVVNIGGRVPIPGCDGLEIDLDALWAEVGRLRDVE
jgi:hypothetical protein